MVQLTEINDIKGKSMAIRNIITEENPILRKISKEVKNFDENLGELLDDMKETLVHAKGVGLASPQVAVLKRVFIIMVNEDYIEFINPKITKVSGSQCGQEGCLSIPGKFADVVRPNKVSIDFQNRYGEPMSLTATGFMARAICHEYDHLNGVLYVDLIKDKK